MISSFNKEQAIKNLEHIEDYNLYKAVDLTIWLYVDKKLSFEKAINIAANKRGIKPTSKIKNIVINAIPKEYFLARRANAQSQWAREKINKDNVSRRQIQRMDTEARRHLSDIMFKDD